MTLEQQIKDWKELKLICASIRNLRQGQIRQDAIGELYAGVRRYYKTYKTKFDMVNQPK